MSKTTKLIQGVAILLVVITQATLVPWPWWLFAAPLWVWIVPLLAIPALVFAAIVVLVVVSPVVAFVADALKGPGVK